METMPLKLRKSTVKPPPCPITQCMAFMRGAWAPNVIWYLSGGPRRFGELRSDIPMISAKILSARLKELELRGIIRRQVMPTSPPSAEYSLTELGRELLPAIEAIAAVGKKIKDGGQQARPAA